MVPAALPRRYARAVLGLAREERRLGPVGDELERAAEALEEPHVRAVVRNPALGAAGRAALATAVAEALGLSDLVRRTLVFLAARDRLAVLPGLARAYQQLLDQELDRARATITSAVPLRAAQRNELLAVVRRLSGKSDVVATMRVDPELLGGVIVETEGVVYDGSLRTQLERLGRQMSKEYR